MTNSISIIYSQKLVADALKSLLENETDFKVEELIEYDHTDKIILNNSFIVLFEINYPSEILLNYIKKLKALGYKVFIVGQMIVNDIVSELIDAGIDAYILKSCGKRNLLMGVDQIASGKKFFCSSITEALNQRFNNISDKKEHELTYREKEILKGIVNFKNTQQIAEILNISKGTVRTHRKNIMSKLGAKNYIGLLRRACSLGLLSDKGHDFCEGCAKVRCQTTLIG